MICIVIFGVRTGGPQQEGQYIPGQQGLNAGVLPTPGFTYANITINYSADRIPSVLTVTQVSAEEVVYCRGSLSSSPSLVEPANAVHTRDEMKGVTQ
jgi:hypothetical protein